MARNPISALFGRAHEERSQDAVDALAQAFFYGGNVSGSGVRITPETALASVAVDACIEVRAETFSALPGGVFRRQDRKRIPLPTHEVQRLLFERPNDLMTGGELLRWKQIREDTQGNALIRIVWKGGRPVELWPLYGANPQVKVSNGKVAYRYTGDDITPGGDIPAADVLHFKGPLLKNPLEAASPIDMIKDTIGLSIASEQFFGRFLNNGSHFPTYLETDNVLTEDDMKAIAKSLKSTAGVFEAGKTRVFDRGLKLKQNAMSLRDADLSSQMRWYLEQICRIFRVPLPLVQDWTHGTYTNSEQAGLWFAQHTITPICVDTERVVRRLFIPGEDDHYVKFNVDAQLRGDYTSRTQGYSVLINCGVLSPNEARAFEDMDPFDGGDEHRLPLNTAPVGMELGAPEVKPAPISAKGQEQPAAPDATVTAGDATEPRSAFLEPVLQDALDRVRLRGAQDRERGRDEAQTVSWALETVMPAVIRAFDLAGIPFDPRKAVFAALTAA